MKSVESYSYNEEDGETKFWFMLVYSGNHWLFALNASEVSLPSPSSWLWCISLMNFSDMKLYDWLFVYFIRGNLNPCDEFTLGKCDIPPAYFDQWTITENSEKCQKFCIENACVTFQYTFDTKNCTLMKEDYRQVCTTVGLPNVSFLLIDYKVLYMLLC